MIQLSFTARSELPTQRVIATGEDRPPGRRGGAHDPDRRPVSATIGEPDIPPRTRSAAWVIHSGPLKWRMVQENHLPSSDSSRADAQKFTGCRTRSAIGSAVAVAVSAL